MVNTNESIRNMERILGRQLTKDELSVIMGMAAVFNVASNNIDQNDKQAKGKNMVQVIGNIGVSDIRYGNCPWCLQRIREDESPYYCGHCGHEVKWND